MKIMESESTLKAQQLATNLNDCRKYAQLRGVSGNALFEEFLSKCEEVVKPTNELRRGIEKIRKRFDQVDVLYKDSQSFISFLQNIIPRVTAEPWQCMKSVADMLKRYPARKSITQATDSTANAHSSQSSIPDEKTQRLIGKLESTLTKLGRKIQSLEEAEVDLQDSDEENSSYMQVSRYKKRFCLVLNKVRELKKMTNHDKPTVIRFSGTRIPSVNRAIERFYSDKKEFPDFHDILNVVVLVNNRRNLGLSQAKIHETAKIAFEELGQTLKLQRQYEFHDIMSTYLPNEREDPALVDNELERKLAENQRLHGHKIDEVINKFAIQQEKDHLQPVEVSSDAESLVSDSEEEDGIESVTSVSEREVESPSDEETPVRTCSVALADVTKLPVWTKYQTRSTPPMSRELVLPCEVDEPCCSKSLLSASAGSRKRKESDSEDSADASDTKRGKFILPVRPVSPSECEKDKEETVQSVEEAEESTPSTCELEPVVQVEPSTQMNHGLDQSSREDVSPQFLRPDSTSKDECVVVDCEIQPATRALSNSVASSKHSSALSAPPSLPDVTTSPVPAKNADNLDGECRDGTVITDNGALENDVTLEIDSGLPSGSLLPDEFKCASRESLASPSENVKRCEQAVIARSAPSVNSCRSPCPAESVPSGASSTAEAKDNDDDIVIVDEISPPKELAEMEDRNEIIDVDKLENGSPPPPKKRARVVDLNSIARNASFVSPISNSGPSTSRRLNNFNGRHQSNSLRYAVNAEAARSIPNLGYRPRIGQPMHLNANYSLQQSGRRAIHQVNQRLHFNQTLCKRTTQTNEVRYVQNTYQIAKRTTMVEESVLRTSAPPFSAAGRRDFSTPLRDYNCPNSALRIGRRLVRRTTPCAAQPTRVQGDTTDEVVTLD